MAHMICLVLCDGRADGRLDNDCRAVCHIG